MSEAGACPPWKEPLPVRASEDNERGTEGQGWPFTAWTEGFSCPYGLQSLAHQVREGESEPVWKWAQEWTVSSRYCPPRARPGGKMLTAVVLGRGSGAVLPARSPHQATLAPSHWEAGIYVSSPWNWTGLWLPSNKVTWWRWCSIISKKPSRAEAPLTCQGE